MSEDPDRFLPAWSRAYRKMVRAGIVKEGDEAEKAFLNGWTAGEKHAIDTAMHHVERLLKGWIRS